MPLANALPMQVKAYISVRKTQLYENQVGYLGGNADGHSYR